ncbi:hypothetical protein BpHYR1_048515 [Brachionus plicatilis]|uniref:Uncharacterized protein n=1 Tax=Brachionus plicatilis TaxID=10195 RepID=A0A3M7Q7L4_BRAPC|nr:hypothetical protein BpHYR1_048515 [Brachionus plicatilis]
MSNLPSFVFNEKIAYKKPVKEISRIDKIHPIIYPDIMIRKIPKSANFIEIKEAIDSIKDLSTKVDYVRLVKSENTEKPWSQVGFLRLLDQSKHDIELKLLIDHFTKNPYKGSSFLQFSLSCRKENAIVITKKSAFDELLEERIRFYETTKKKTSEIKSDVEKEPISVKQEGTTHKYNKDDCFAFERMTSIATDCPPNPEKPNPYECSTERMRLFVHHFYENIHKNTRGVSTGFNAYGEHKVPTQIEKTKKIEFEFGTDMRLIDKERYEHLLMKIYGMTFPKLADLDMTLIEISQNFTDNKPETLCKCSAEIPFNF